MLNVDVLVVGGGSAGLAAAISAARRGARTLLVERGGSLGGMAPAALVHSICGLYRLPEAAPKSDLGEAAAIFANDGFATEFATRLIGAGGAHGPVRMGRVDVLLQQPTAFARLADEMARETENLRVRSHSELISVGRDFRSAVVCCRGRAEEIETSVIIDTSGDAIAASLGGAATEEEVSARLQRPAFIFALNGVAAGALDDDGRLRIARRISSAVQSAALPAGALGAALRASGRGGEAFVTIDLDVPDYDPLDADCLTALEVCGRDLAGRVADFLRAQMPGFSDSFISAFPTRVGVRESRRIVGRARLEAADLEQSATFPDAIASAAWPMELRETNRGARLRFPLDGQPCDIPLGALRARDHANLFAAGRCLSCSHEAQASIRVIGTCLATGEAAGLAAALFARTEECEAGAVRSARAEVSRGAVAIAA